MEMTFSSPHKMGESVFYYDNEDKNLKKGLIVGFQFSFTECGRDLRYYIRQGKAEPKIIDGIFVNSDSSALVEIMDHYNIRQQNE